MSTARRARDPQEDRRRSLSVFRRQPSWVLPSLGILLATALVLYGWRLGASGLSTYYASSAKSMADNWRAFAFGALDPASTWTLDKLSGFLVPQALAIKLLGFHPWVLDLPQLIEGFVTIVTSYVIGARWRGPAVGILVASIMTVTPLLAAMFGHPTEDALLTMAMGLAFAAWQRAILSGRWAWMLLAAAWVAVAFQAKMLQAWLIVPALLIGFAVAATGSRRRRLTQLLAVGVVTAALSVSWMTAIQLVPAADRPYIDGTTNNNTFSMVFAYNGVDRILPGLIPGGVPQLASHAVHAGGGTATRTSGHLITKMLTPDLTTQIGWLYPAAALGILFALREARRRRNAGLRGPPGEGVTTLTAGIWLGLTAAVFSVAYVPHATYFGVVALPIALLASAGVMGSVQRFRSREPRAWILSALLTVQTLWAASIAVLGAPTTRWLAVPVLLVGVAAVITVELSARRGVGPHSRRVRTAALVLSLVAILFAPAVWSSFVLGPGGAGSASDAYAGPRPGLAPRPAPAPRSVTLATEERQRQLLQYVIARGAGSVRFATDTLAIAVAINLDTGQEVEPLGGFSRQAPWLSSAALAHQVASGTIRFVLLAPHDPLAPPNPTLAAARSWTATHCRPVLAGRFRAGSHLVQTLYHCPA